MWYHNHSKKHLENQTKINMDADNYYENEIK
jgi:hypothetical protein